MKINNKYNGFASEEQYEAVKSAVNECVGRDSIEVKYDKDTDTIYVDGWYYSFNIAGDMLTSIEMDDSDVFDDVMTIYESHLDIWEAFVSNKPKEQIMTINDDDFGSVKVCYSPEQKVIIADGLRISNVPTNYKYEDIMSAWQLFKCHYWEYGALGLAYEQIADGESLFDRY